MSKQTFGTIYDALPEDPKKEQSCNVKVSQSVRSQYCRAIKEEKKSTQKERIAKNRSKKSKPTMAQEIDAWKQICQFYQTFDVCELADMGVI